MKKILIALLVMAMTLSFAACGGGNSDSESSQGVDIVPLPVMEINAENPEDCTANASFEVSDINFDDNTITFTAYAEELFDAVEVTTLKAGDTITTEGNTITVETAEENDGAIIVNGGLESENGIELVPNEGGTYRISLMNDYCTFAEIGEYTLPLAEDVNFVDCIDEMEGVTIAPAELKAYLEGLPEYKQTFGTFATTLTIEGGKVTEIKRIWVP